jgi:hypothetical protein
MEQSQIIPGLPSQDIQSDDIFSAFSSPTAGLLFCWQYSGIDSKSSAEMKHLARTFLDDDDYQREDARTYDDVREKRLLMDYLKDKSNPFQIENGWCSSSVKIRLPKEREKFPSEDEAPEMEILGIYHCSIIDIITSIFEDSIASTVIPHISMLLFQTSESRSGPVRSTDPLLIRFMISFPNSFPIHLTLSQPIPLFSNPCYRLLGYLCIPCAY